MHFRRADRTAQLEAGSSDANFNLDFGRNVALPAAPACTPYFDILAAIQGLTTFANALWYEPLTRPLYRLREFVAANMDADPHHSPHRVSRTLHEINHHLGSVYIHLSSDSPLWWRDFCAAAARIEFTSVAWAMALHELAHVEPASGDPRRQVASSGPAAPTRPRRDDAIRIPASRPGGIPANVRSLIPRNDDGDEPCLRFFGGGMCPEGTRTDCAIPGRTHTWHGDIPPALKAFAVRKFGRRNHPDRRRM
jgi:hypothetical protein